jgi:hypothetical protein
VKVSDKPNNATSAPVQAVRQAARRYRRVEPPEGGVRVASGFRSIASAVHTRMWAGEVMPIRSATMAWKCAHSAMSS